MSNCPAIIGEKYTRCGIAQLSAVNSSWQADTVKTPAPLELSMVTTTLVPAAGCIPRVTFATATLEPVTCTGQGVMPISYAGHVGNEDVEVSKA